MGHCARVLPRAVFRGQVLAILPNGLIFVAVRDWMVAGSDDDSVRR